MHGLGDINVQYPVTSGVTIMQLTHDEWYERTTALLSGSDIPREFVEECLTNRVAMHKLCQDGYAAAEVVMHLSKEFRNQQAELKKMRDEQVCSQIPGHWYYIEGWFIGKMRGPITTRQLLDLVECGQITPTTRISWQGRRPEPARNFKWLFD